MRSSRIFYGWYVVAMALAGNFMSAGVGFYIFNAFMKPLSAAQGWSRADINMAPAIGGVVGLVGMLLYGTLVMRTGPRILMTAGALVSGISFACLGQVDEIWLFYLVYVVLFFGNGAMGGIVANTAVNNWFVAKRGKAMGLATTGVSLSGAFLPLVAMFLIERVSLSAAFSLIGGAIGLVAPLAWLVVRNRPEEYGLRPDGRERKKVTEPSGTPLGHLGFNGSFPLEGGSVIAPRNIHWTFKMAFGSPVFWKLGLAFAFSLMGIAGVMFQLAPRFEDLGFDKTSAMYLMSVTALIGAVGKYVWGVLCDRFNPNRVVAVLMAANAGGLALGLIPESTLAMVLFIVVFGFAMGGIVSTTPVMIAHVFGREAYASVARFQGVLSRLFLFGYIVMGQSFERTGSYDAAYFVFIVLNVVALLLVLSIKKDETYV